MRCVGVGGSVRVHAQVVSSHGRVDLGGGCLLADRGLNDDPSRGHGVQRRGCVRFGKDVLQLGEGV